MIFDTGGRFHEDSKIELLWTNPNPNVLIDSTITTSQFNTSKYSFFLVVTKAQDSLNQYETNVILSHIGTEYRQKLSVLAYPQIFSRSVTVNMDGLSFSANGAMSYVDVNSTTESKPAAIPMYVYGVSK